MLFLINPKLTSEVFPCFNVKPSLKISLSVGASLYLVIPNRSKVDFIMPFV